MNRGHAIVVVSLTILLLGLLAAAQEDAAVGHLNLPIAAGPCAAITSGTEFTNQVAKFSATNCQIVGSTLLFENGTSVGIKTSTPSASAVLDVNGKTILRGVTTLGGQGSATSTGGKNSQALDFISTSFSSSLSVSVNQHFRWQAEPVNNNTATPSGSMNLLFAPGTGTTAETGVKFLANGTFMAPTIHGTNISANAIAANGLAVGGNGSVGGNLTVTGTASANTLSASTINGTTINGAFVGDGSGVSNVNAVALGGFAAANYPRLAVSNNFTADQTITGNLGVSGNIGAGTTTPGIRLNVNGGSALISTLTGGLWFQTQHLGSTGSLITGFHHMLIAPDTAATKQESIGIWHCNGVSDNTTAAVCGGILFPRSVPFEAFRFQFDGNAFAAVAWNAGGVDVAEKYPNFAEGLQAGDVVMLDTNSGADFKLIASTAPYQENVLGVVSEKPGVILGGSGDKLEDAKGIPVALAGRVPVKVTLENGPIHAGDYLTSSSRAGYAMKATKSGRVIGIALTSFGSDSDSANSTGKVTVFVNAHHWENGEEVRQLRAELESLKGELASRDQQVRELRSEFNQFREALGVQKAALIH